MTQQLQDEIAEMIRVLQQCSSRDSIATQQLLTKVLEEVREDQKVLNIVKSVFQRSQVLCEGLNTCVKCFVPLETESGEKYLYYLLDRESAVLIAKLQSEYQKFVHSIETIVSNESGSK